VWGSGSDGEKGGAGMTTNVSRPPAGVAPARHAGLRVAVGLLGVAAVGVGVVLLFDPVAAARTLALLLGLSLVIGGLLEIAVGWDAGRRRGISIALGAVLAIGGLLAVAWPGITLVALALITGVSLIVHGAGRVGTALLARDEVPGWGWLALAGAVNVIVGVVAVAWPQATVLVLSLVLGAQIAAFGVLLLAFAFRRPDPRLSGQPVG
jgi:uncharacterized membrane protein HdeD (DUF308 family)